MYLAFFELISKFFLMLKVNFRQLLEYLSGSVQICPIRKQYSTWDVQTISGMKLRVFEFPSQPKHKGFVGCVAWTAQNELVSCGDDHRILLFQVTATVEHILKNKPGPAQVGAISKAQK